MKRVEPKFNNPTIRDRKHNESRSHNPTEDGAKYTDRDQRNAKSSASLSHPVDGHESDANHATNRHAKCSRAA
jgi:hypothetical protein